jgi:hypothetical protein
VIVITIEYVPGDNPVNVAEEAVRLAGLLVFEFRVKDAVPYNPPDHESEIVLPVAVPEKPVMVLGAGIVRVVLSEVDPTKFTIFS